MQESIYEKIAKGNRKAIQTEIEKQKGNIENYTNAKYESVNAKKMCLFSINGIKELMYSVSEIAKRYGYEDLQIKAGYVATMASNLYDNFSNEVKAQSKNNITMYGEKVETKEAENN